AQDGAIDEPLEGPPPEGMRGDPHHPPHDGYLGRYMEHLRLLSPEEFEELDTLRREHPEQFRKVLRDKLKERNAWKSFEDDPELKETLMSLPEDRRQRLLHKFGKLKDNAGPKRGKGESENRKVRQLELEVRDLARTYHEAPDEEKEELKSALRTKLEALFAEREQERQKQIDRMRGKLDELQEAFEKRQSLRNEIIDRRLQDLTEGDTLKW
ncbi:MAG: hypothetical protein KJ626_00905, partial [Verrucomicrobia bacterium]|nr:hypothetical protein [Verrucomicrobiota bacterium]